MVSLATMVSDDPGRDHVIDLRTGESSAEHIKEQPDFPCVFACVFVFNSSEALPLAKSC